MLTLAVMLAFGQIGFLEQPLPGVRIGPVTPFTGQPATNYLHADFNGDAALDLVLPEYANLQEDGGYPESRRLPMPPCDGAVEADIFGATLFYRRPDHLSTFTFSNGAWHTEIDQPLAWPADEPSFTPGGSPDAVPVFRRFTYDMDGDGAPELIGLDAGGVHVFREQNGQYAAAGILAVYPSTNLNPSAPQAIWPSAQRRVVLPKQQMSCRVLVTGNALAVVTDTHGSEGGLVFQRDIITLERDGEGHFAVAGRTTSASSEMPPHLRPCRLNDDDTLDYAGERWSLSESTPMPLPIQETWASLDGGRTFHIERAPSFPQFRPHAAFLDFDSDGRMDMVLESTTIFAGGLRETISQYLARKSLTHTIRIHAQDETGYARIASASTTVEIELESPPASPGPMLERYQAGELANLTGDFNGDGFLDLVARTAPGRVIVRLAQGWTGFDAAPTATLAVSELARVAVADINGDRLADLLVRVEDTAGTEAAGRTTAYITRKGAP